MIDQYNQIIATTTTNEQRQQDNNERENENFLKTLKLIKNKFQTTLNNNDNNNVNNSLISYFMPSCIQHMLLLNENDSFKYEIDSINLNDFILCWLNKEASTNLDDDDDDDDDDDTCSKLNKINFKLIEMKCNRPDCMNKCPLIKRPDNSNSNNLLFLNQIEYFKYYYGLSKINSNYIINNDKSF